MSLLKKDIILNYPVEDIFSIFKEATKKSFPNFNPNNPLESSVSQKGNKRFNACITEYKENKLYEIKISNKRWYTITRYEFNCIDKNKTHIFFTETESERNFFGKLNKKLNILLFGKNQEDEFYNFIKQISYTLDNRKDNKEEE